MNTREQRRLAVSLGRVAALREVKARGESARAHHAVQAKQAERDALVQAQAEAEADVLRAETPLPTPRPVHTHARAGVHPVASDAHTPPAVSGALFQLVAASRQTFRQEQARVDQDLAQREAAARAQREAHTLAMRRRFTRDRVADKVTRQWRFETNRALDRTLTDESAARRAVGTD